MKLMLSTVAAGATLVLCGCRTATVYPDNDAPPRYGERVLVVTYDSTPRAFNPSIQVYNNPQTVQGHPRHPIAEVEMDGWYRDRVLIENALIWRAKSLGADGVILLPPNFGGYEAVPFGPVGRKFSFRGEAFVWPNHINVAGGPGAMPPPATTQPNTPPPSAPPADSGATPPPPASVPPPQ